MSLVNRRFKTWQEAHEAARELAAQTGLDLAIRVVREFGGLGYNVTFACHMDSDYDRAEIVRGMR